MPIASIHNQILFDKKKQLLGYLRPTASAHFYTFNLHGLKIRLYSQHTKFIKQLDFLPSQTFDVEIFHTEPTEQGFDANDFEDEFESQCLTGKLNQNEYAIQRDFIAVDLGKQVLTVFNSANTDGLNNFLRWFISRRLLHKNMAIFHSSAIVGHHQKAYVFLGPSGAGKTTTCFNADGRKIIGDDMNLIEIEDQQVYVRPAQLGGRLGPEIPIESRIPVAGFYWLQQANEIALEKLSIAIATQKIMASMANLFWGEDDHDLSQSVFFFAHKITQNYPVNLLKLKNNHDYWNLLEPNYFKIKLHGRSMLPLFQHDQEVTVHKNNELKLGQIYLYYSTSGELVAHRLIGLNPLTFKGDNEINHEFIKRNQIIGEVMAPSHYVRAFKNLSQFNHRDCPGIIRRLARASMNFLYRLNQPRL